MSKEKPWQDEETLRRLYHDEGLSRAKMAERFGDVTEGGVHYWMDKHGIEARSKSESAKNRWLNNPDVSIFTEEIGYERCSLGIDGETHRFLVHRLVAVAEYGFEEVKNKHIHHKNGIEWDNRPSNLEPLTRSEHMKHHWDNGDMG